MIENLLLRDPTTVPDMPITLEPKPEVFQESVIEGVYNPPCRVPDIEVYRNNTHSSLGVLAP